tara:strand:+ start:283 stop:477 length:195 start_codon:yes stop_codon:yes gene_type:complete
LTPATLACFDSTLNFQHPHEAMVDAIPSGARYTAPDFVQPHQFFNQNDFSTKAIFQPNQEGRKI